MWNRFRYLATLLAIIPGVGLFLAAQTPPASPPSPAPATQTTPAPAGPQAPSGGGTLSSTSNEGADFSPKPPIKARTPEDQARSFVLPPGYRMELVVAEPAVINPAVIRFDGNGRMYVAEFLTYMRDAAATNQHTQEARLP